MIFSGMLRSTLYLKSLDAKVVFLVGASRPWDKLVRALPLARICARDAAKRYAFPRVRRWPRWVVPDSENVFVYQKAIWTRNQWLVSCTAVPDSIVLNWIQQYSIDCVIHVVLPGHKDDVHPPCLHAVNGAEAAVGKVVFPSGIRKSEPYSVVGERFLCGRHTRAGTKVKYAFAFLISEGLCLVCLALKISCKCLATICFCRAIKGRIPSSVGFFIIQLILIIVSHQRSVSSLC